MGERAWFASADPLVGAGEELPNLVAAARIPAPGPRLITDPVHTLLELAKRRPAGAHEITGAAAIARGALGESPGERLRDHFRRFPPGQVV